MGLRYNSRSKISIETERKESHKKLLKKRDRKKITLYKTAKLRHPSALEISDLRTVGHVWKAGDRLFKLAHEHYNSPGLWWVIAWFNEVPTESDIELGQTLQVPLPIESILSKLGV